jgi:hypothetical protein
MKIILTLITLLSASPAFAGQFRHYGAEDNDQLEQWKQDQADQLQNMFHTDIINTPNGQRVCQSSTMYGTTVTNCN